MFRRQRRCVTGGLPPLPLRIYHRILQSPVVAGANHPPLLPAVVDDLPTSTLAAADSANLARRLELCEILFNASYRQANFRRKPFARYLRKLLEKFQNLYPTFYHTFSHTCLKPLVFLLEELGEPLLRGKLKLILREEKLRIGEWCEVLGRLFTYARAQKDADRREISRRRELRLRTPRGYVLCGHQRGTGQAG